VTADLSFLHLILDASLVVQIVMLILVLASIFSWAVIYGKSRQFSSALRLTKGFEQEFWSTGDITEMYARVSARRSNLSGLERIFSAGYSEFGRLRRQTHSSDVIMDGSRRAMRIAVSREQESIETNLTFLATIGSTSPYIGLFGTVWGIMNSFTALGNVQQATLAMVAPGIAEALIATAMGLFAAIPAVIFYNRLSSEADRLLQKYETFSEEFSTVLHRQSVRIQEKAGSQVA
jgi:biopolymer transport protein TolQ